MTRAEIERAIERVFRDKWNYAAGDPAYFQDKARRVGILAEGLGAITGRKVRIERPANLQNFHRLEVCLTAGVDEPRDEISYETVRARAPVVYLEILCSVILPVSQGSWRVFSTAGDALVQAVHDLLAEQWLIAHPEHEDVAIGVLQLAEANRLTVVASELLRTEADPSLPVPFPGNVPATLRDFVFPGVLD